MPGPPPKPTKLKVLAGNPGKKPLNKREPVPVPIAPDPPAWLSAEAAAKWAEVVPELDRLGLLGRIDGSALVGLCECWAAFVAASRQVQAEGITVETAKGPILNPAFRAQQEASRQLRLYCAEFGLSPASRSRITLPEAADGDLETILAG